MLRVESTFHTILRLRGWIQICVETLTDKAVTAEGQGTKMIEIVNTKFQDEEGIPPDQWRLCRPPRPNKIYTVPPQCQLRHQCPVYPPPLPSRARC